MSTDRPQPASLAFSRGSRLTHPSEFAEVRARGRSHRSELLTLGLLEREENTGFRVGFVTSKRVGNAVVRNRVRRRLREIVRRHQHSIQTSVWLVLIARPAAARASYRALEDDWLRLAKRALILAPACS